MAKYTQDKAPIAVETPLGKDKLLLEGFSGTEELGRLFRFDLDLLSPEESIDPKEIVGKKVSFRVNHSDGSPRWFCGYVSRFARVGQGKRVTRWRAEVVPGLWFLTRTSDCKTFQDATVPDIASMVLGEFSSRVDVQNSLHGRYTPWEYCVQYRETDFNFVSRLLEHEGISYFFKHDKTTLTTVLADGASAYAECHDSQVEGVSSFGSESSPGLLSTWTQEWSLRSGQFAQRDYNFKTATTDLVVTVRGKPGFEGASDLEVYDYPGEYEKTSDGTADLKRRIEAEEVAAHTVRGSSGCRSFSPGYTFKDADGTKYLLTAVSHSASIRGAYESGAADGEFVYVNTFSAIPADVPFRPERSTPKPMVGGSQTAVVVGKSGEELDTDEHGRIKVQFHWDRLGKKDEKSSCWVRVAQSIAGPGWGAQFIPRIGQEVVVSYLEGDPDQPLVTGVVYNSQNKPPYSLPDNKTQSGFRSRSSKGGGDKTCNEIRFEDKKGAEEVLLHAEKDFKREVENDDHLEVGFLKKDPGSRTVKVFNDHTETIGCAQAKSGSRTTTVWKDDVTTLKTGNQSITIEQGNRSIVLKVGGQTLQLDLGNDSTRLKLGNRSAKLDVGKDSVEALQGITLKSGPSSIEITPTGITIKGLKVQVEGQVQTSVKGLMTEINGTAMLKAGGAITMIG